MLVAIMIQSVRLRCYLKDEFATSHITNKLVNKNHFPTIFISAVEILHEKLVVNSVHNLSNVPYRGCVRQLYEHNVGSIPFTLTIGMSSIITSELQGKDFFLIKSPIF